MNKSRKYKKKSFSFTKKRRYQAAGQQASKESQISKPPISETNTNTNTSTNTKEKVDPAVEKIKEEVEAEKTIHLPSLGLPDSTEVVSGTQEALSNAAEATEGILATTGDLIEGATINTLEGVGELVGVDLTDPHLAEENKEKIQEITKNAAEIGTVALEAAAPFTDKLIDDSVEASGHALSKMGEAGVKVLLNTAEEIPGVGIIIGTLRSADAIGKAVLSSVNAGSEVIESSSDTLNATLKNFDRLMEEKEETENRVKASIDEFSGGSTYKKYRNRMKNKTKKRKHSKRK
jgi:hypothetical protein